MVGRDDGEDGRRTGVGRVMRCLLPLTWVFVLAACGQDGAPSAEPVAVEPPCEGPALRFQPSGRYRVEVRERGQVYRSTLEFEATDDGWSAVESELSVEPATNALGDLEGAELHWTLDESGVPLEPPRIVGEAHPGVLPNLTVFAFRPAGLTMDPVCPDVAAIRRWVDGMERTRRSNFQVARIGDDAVVFSVTSSVATAVNEWRIEGRVTVDRTDGFAGEAELEVTGPRAPEVNHYSRRVTIERTE